MSLARTRPPAVQPDTAAEGAAVPPPRRRILDAAMLCFARAGFHGASMQEICAEARMSAGALYRHFPSKDAIIVAIAEEENARHAAFFQALAAAEDPVEALLSIGLDTLDAVKSGWPNGLAAEVLAEATRTPAIRLVVERHCGAAREAMVDALRRGQARGLVDPAMDLDTACRLLIALADGLLAHRALDPGLESRAVRPVLSTLLRRFLRPRDAALRDRAAADAVP